MQKPGTLKIRKDKPIAVGYLHVLSLLLAAPTRETLSLLEQLTMLQQWLVPVCRELRSISLDEWQAEHSRLFASGSSNSACSPFKSAYQGKRAMTEELYAIYHDLGFKVDEISADYLGAMLECWGYLLEQDRVRQAATFWRDHLAGWLPRFAEDLQEAAELELYKELAAQFSDLCAVMGEA